jgi:hypothetical protein
MSPDFDEAMAGHMALIRSEHAAEMARIKRMLAVEPCTCPHCGKPITEKQRTKRRKLAALRTKAHMQLVHSA